MWGDLRWAWSPIKKDLPLPDGSSTLTSALWGFRYGGRDIRSQRWAWLTYLTGWALLFPDLCVSTPFSKICFQVICLPGLLSWQSPPRREGHAAVGPHLCGGAGVLRRESLGNRQADLSPAGLRSTEASEEYWVRSPGPWVEVFHFPRRECCLFV